MTFKSPYSQINGKGQKSRCDVCDVIGVNWYKSCNLTFEMGQNKTAFTNNIIIICARRQTKSRARSARMQ